MNLTIFLEQRMLQAPNNTVWSPIGYNRKFWERYLQVFSNITICARVLPVEKIPKSAVLLNGDRISIAALPHYVGPWEFIRVKPAVQRKVINVVQLAEALILRVPSQICWQAHSMLVKMNRPYGVEVVGDPWDVFATGSVKNLARPLFRLLFTYRLRKQCKLAASALYVTESSLQKRYPSKKEAFSTHASNVELPNDAFISTSKHFSADRPLRLIFVGTFAQMYKAPDVLIKAVAQLVHEGHDIHLTMLGTGRFRSDMKGLTKSLNIQTSVDFLGLLPAGDVVRAQLDRADIFILPSLTEGLPRAMIEAMARGLPCIGSDVGGIPELLSEEYLVPAGDVNALVRKIRMFITQPKLLKKCSKNNLQASRQYNARFLNQRRSDFYNHLVGATQTYMTS